MGFRLKYAVFHCLVFTSLCHTFGSRSFRWRSKLNEENWGTLHGIHSQIMSGSACGWKDSWHRLAKVVYTTLVKGCVLQAHSNGSREDRGSIHVLHKAWQTWVGLLAELAATPAENPKRPQSSPFKLQLAANCSTAVEKRRRRNRETLSFNSI